MNALNAQVTAEIARARPEVSARRRDPRGDHLRRRAGVRRRRRHQGDGAARCRRDDMAWHGAVCRPRSTRWRASPSRSSRRSPATRSAAACELALCADFRVLGESAKVGQPEILLGVIPGAGGTQRLPRLIGPAKAKDLIFTGRHVAAAEALAIGLADQVVPDAEVYQAARDMAAQYASGPARRAARGQAGDRQRTRDRPGDRARHRAAALRVAVRHRGPEERDAQLRGERPGKGRLRGPVAVKARDWE